MVPSTSASVTVRPWARTHPYIRADIIWVFVQAFSYATARLVDPQHTLWAQYGVSADTTTAGSTGVLARFLEDTLVITKDQDLGLLQVDMEPFTFHANLPCLELGDSAPCHQCREASMVHQCKTHARMPPVPELRAVGRRTPTPMPDSSQYWPLTCTRLRALEYMPSMTHTVHSSTLRLLKAHHRPFLGTWSKAFSRSMKAK